jgi:hypothetical protein
MASGGVSGRMMTRFNQSRHAVVTRKGTGIGSDLISVVGAIAYAARTERDLVIDWRKSRYLEDATTNLFAALFVAPTAFDSVGVVVAGPKFNGTELLQPVSQMTARRQSFEDFHAEMLAAPRRVAESVIITRPMHHLPDVAEQKRWLGAIAPVPRIAAAIDRYYDRHMKGHAVVGIHIRHGNGETLGSGRDMLIQRSVDELVDLSIAAVAKMDLPADPLFFVCTDSQALRDAFKARLTHVINFDSRIGSAESGPIHTSDFGLQGAEDAVAEMWLLARCDRLIYSPSWFSHYARTVGTFSAEPVNLDTVSLYGTAELYETRLGQKKVERRGLVDRILAAIGFGNRT